ncbi:hypothetical protein GCM10017567_23540 [Amycolatopsis bullii]|uniref:Uncharacterized protein n=1 Tax=Amycolatopsis bullii TaxID=941987 RepID=A0ABQ3K7P3_9PSEU|nr:hypothetical protein GCM10017567_23540 [Amycolatopsis bullii]
MGEARIETARARLVVRRLLAGGRGPDADLRLRLAPRQDHPLRHGDRLESGPIAAVYSDGTGGVRQTRNWQRPSSGGVLR